MSKKKSNGEGSIVRRTDGRYMARYTMDGKRYAIYGTSHEEVRVQLTEVLGNIDKGAHIAPFQLHIIPMAPGVADHLCTAHC